MHSILESYRHLLDDALGTESDPYRGFKETPARTRILTANQREKCAIASALPAYITELIASGRQSEHWIATKIENAQRLLLQLIETPMPFEHDELVTLLSPSRYDASSPYADYMRLRRFIDQAAEYLNANPLTPLLSEALVAIRTRLLSHYSIPEIREELPRLSKLLGTSGHELPLIEGEAWSDAATTGSRQ